MDADLTCPPTCDGPDNPPRYPPTMSGQHLLDMVDAIFNYRKDKA